MRQADVSVPGSFTVQCPNRCVLLTFCIVMLAMTPGTLAQTSGAQSLPSSVVLVLKLVSSNYVKPVTGVVISNDGQVLIPADFVSAGDEIVVLDGGTDIVRHGRPTRLVKRSSELGLAVLEVEGLNRPAINLALAEPGNTADLHLAAFPPADKIAEGAEPLWQTLKTSLDDETAHYSVSADTPLPNITGAIINACGQLAGLNLASGTQSLQPHAGSTTLFSAELSRIFAMMQIEVTTARCNGTPLSQDRKDPAATSNRDGVAASELEILNQAEPSVDTEATTVSPPVEPQDAEESGTTTGVLQPIINETGPKEAEEADKFPSWLPWLGVFPLIIMAWLVVGMRRQSNNGDTPDKHHSDDAQEEPDTAPLGEGSTFGAVPLATGIGSGNLPDLTDLPTGLDSLLVIEGIPVDGSDFRRYCPVSASNFSVTIGQAGADLVINSAGISHNHARIEGDEESRTLSDLGSRNGTYINSVPCLKGEVMFIEPGDEIMLADFRFQLKLITTDREQA